MAFSDRFRNVCVEGVPVNTNENTSAGELIRSAGQDPIERDLVLAHPDGTTEIIPSSRRIKTKDGQRFETQLTAREG